MQTPKSSLFDDRVAEKVRQDSRDISRQQARYRRDEFSGALRALLMTPLMTPVHAEFAAVRRHADELRAWFARETGWALHIERDCARLYKRPADLTDAGRGLPGYDRRRYVLLCLALAVLERADPQITLHLLGERLLTLAAEPALTERGFTFSLQAPHERRELVAVCRSLLEWGVLQRVAGDEEGYVRSGGEGADALYDVHRRVLAGVLAAVRGPSTWPADSRREAGSLRLLEAAPADFDARLQALVAEHVADSDEGRRSAARHHLARRLLDDPVVYLDALDGELRAYFLNQRGPMAARLCEAAGLTAEQRAEGLALVDDGGELTDLAMPAEGTDAHVTLLVAELLATALRQTAGEAESLRLLDSRREAEKLRLLDSRREAEKLRLLDCDVIAFVAGAKATYGRYWRKSAREPGAERELAQQALDKLQKLQLIARDGAAIQPLPALARFALGEAEIKQTAVAQPAQQSLFDLL
ncbi:MAG: TIGR02678 family protein [Methylococcaceae bacterium]|nr:MAG: TIGR02678 family protein [Methylococcaceae bacterium]